MLGSVEGIASECTASGAQAQVDRGGATGYHRAMERRRFGRTEMKVSVLGFGGSEIGYENASQSTVDRLLGRALDAGLNVIDTAECYVRSEELIGAALGARRRQCLLFTKCGHPDGWGAGDWRPASLLASIERS